MPARDANAALIRHLRDRDFKGGIAVTAQTDDDVAYLKMRGADLVLMPYADAASEAVDRLTDAINRRANSSK